ncbi:MAG: hypothetical protein D6739_12920 [Nitrospirae bacterium]|nr:MAG: hypothetical protein D6739_12920 [Nitrospirota bacterium]
MGRTRRNHQDHWNDDGYEMKPRWTKDDWFDEDETENWDVWREEDELEDWGYDPFADYRDN